VNIEIDDRNLKQTPRAAAGFRCIRRAATTASLNTQ
jgi:hypothetical protein